MPNRFASGKKSIAICDICGFQFKLKTLKTQVVKTKQINDRVCSECWSPDHPQLQLGMYPVEDPQAVRNARRDTTYVTSGTNVDGFPSGGSRDIQWGWNPVGGASQYDNGLTPNYLALTVFIGTVTISTSA
jgi:hypothetical protein